MTRSNLKYQSDAIEQSSESLNQQFSDATLLSALRYILRHLNLHAQIPKNWGQLGSRTSNIFIFCSQNNCLVTEVKFNKQWTNRDFGQVLFLDEKDEVFVLKNVSNLKCQIYNPTNGSNQFLAISELESWGARYFLISPRLDANHNTFFDIGKFVIRSSKKNLIKVGILSLMVGLFSIAVPIGIGQMFNYIIPTASNSLLFQLGIALFVTVVVIELLNLYMNYVFVNKLSWTRWILQSSIIDLVFSQEGENLKKSNSSALARKIMEFEKVGTFFTTSLSQIIFAFLSLAFNLLILIYYSRIIGLVILVALILVAILFYYKVKRVILAQNKIIEEVNWLNSMMLQFFKGINKIKQTSSENRIFSFWKHYYSEILLKDWQLSKQTIVSNILMQNVIWVLQVIIFAIYALDMSELSVGSFVAMNAAFFTIAASFQVLMSIGLSLQDVIPAFNDIKPILSDVEDHKISMHSEIEIKGDIEFNDIEFSYQENSPMVLKGLNLKIQNGQSVALVGPSGSGKSSIVRLLLGFESRYEGSIYIDSLDVRDLDMAQVRQNFGVVLQNDDLLEGSIYDNVCGANYLTEEEFWHIANLASIDADIKEMPMGLHTLVSNSSSTISGGQKQRILIARALANSPKVLIMDESTSALDNLSQDAITSSLASLEMTRIIIAHRLSTIKDVDKIFYIENGKILESGTFDELVAMNKKFKQFVEPQMHGLNL